MAQQTAQIPIAHLQDGTTAATIKMTEVVPDSLLPIIVVTSHPIPTACSKDTKGEARARQATT